jgi:hypothetical protein
VHFLEAAVRRGELRHLLLNQRHAAVLVHVRAKEKVLVLDPGLHIAKGDVQWLVLPEEWRIVSPDGDVIRPSGTFLVTVETFDPCHMVADVRDDLIPFYLRPKKRRAR